MSHRLDPLLRPGSIAVVGASRRAGSVGNAVVRNLVAGGYRGRLFAVNPGYSDVEGVPCFPALSDLPQPVEQAIFAVADARLEAALEAAIAHGVRSCVIYSSLVLEGDTDPGIRERVRRRVAGAGLLVCGANGMGYYNFRDAIQACGFDTRVHRSGGNVTLISQSGSGMSGIVDVEERLDFNLVVSTGQELAVTLEDYLDYALEQAETRVVGLFMETSREPQRLIAGFEKAARRRIPVVAVKVGRTPLSAQLAVSHCGALAGTDAVYDAVFDRYGVQRVRDLDELATALIMFAQPRPAAAGGVVSIHDSGGERQLTIDLADRLDVRLAVLNDATRRELEASLDPGLPAVNPLDAWSAGGPRYHEVMSSCFAALLRDPDAALGAVIHARAPHGRIYPEYIDYLRAGREAAGKPVFLVAARQGIGADALVLEATREGLPVLDGVAAFLSGARCMMDYRDFQQRPEPVAAKLPRGVERRWRARLASGGEMFEAEAMQLLAECGINAVAAQRCGSEEAVSAVAAQLTYPVALKTSMPGVAHKSEVGGVILDIDDADSLLHAYRQLRERLGPEVTVAPMVREAGVEMLLGMKRDDQFGPVIVMGLGGVLAEALDDVVTVIPPFDAATARRLIDGLKLRRLLDGWRGMPAVDIDAFCEAAAHFSVLATGFADLVAEIDVNPVKVLTQGCIALDALVIPSSARPNPALLSRTGTG